MRDSIVGIIDKLRQRDSSVYCGVPAWIVDDIVKNLVDLTEDHIADGDFDVKVREFAIGAIRYVADQCGSEADALVAALHALTEGTADSGSANG